MECVRDVKKNEKGKEEPRKKKLDRLSKRKRRKRKLLKNEKIMKGVVIIRDKGVDTEYNEVDDIR